MIIRLQWQQITTQVMMKKEGRHGEDVRTIIEAATAAGGDDDKGRIMMDDDNE